MVGAGCEPELRGECFGLLGLEAGGLEVAGGGERVEGGGEQGGSPAAVRGAGYPPAVTWRYPFRACLSLTNPAGPSPERTAASWARGGRGIRS